MKSSEMLDPREIRRRLKMNQQQFWSSIGVTQSGGSRYEAGRSMPKPVRELLRVVHIEGLDLAKVKREDSDILEYLKANHPDLYEDLRLQTRSRYRQEETISHFGGDAITLEAAY